MSSNSTTPSRPTSSRPSTFGFKPSPDADMELRDIILILRRRKLVVLAGIALGVVLASYMAITAPRLYSSTSTIEVNKESGNTLGLEDLSGMSSLGGGDQLNVDLMTQVAVITDENTVLAVIAQLRLDSMPPYAIPAVKNGKETPLSRERGLPLEKAPNQRVRLLGMFKSRLAVKIIKGTRLISITYTDTDPNRSTAIANAVVDAYVNEYTQARYQASSKTSSWLGNQLADLKDKVSSSQEKAEAFQREAGLVGMASMQGASGGGRSGGSAQPAASPDNIPMARLLDLNKDLTNAEVSRIAKEAAYHMTETQDPDVVLGVGSSSLATDLGSNSVLSPGSPDLQLLQKLREQRAQLGVELAASNTKYGAKNPAVLQLHNQENVLDGQIRAEMERIRTRAKNDLALATLSENGIRQRISVQEQEVNKTSAKEDQLLLLQEEALSSREIYQNLYSKLEEASVSAGMKASNITLVSPARNAAVPSSPKVKAIVEMGALVGLVLGLIAAFLWDYFDDSVTTAEQIEHLTSVPVIGVIPDHVRKQGVVSNYGYSSGAPQPEESKSHAWVLRSPQSRIAEAYRSFRTAILLSRAEQPPKVILITSGSPGEGKSTTCFNTAASFAIQGARVLYIDADLRRSTACKFFNCSNGVGLTNCLTSGVPYETALKQSSEIETLYLLPSGYTAPNPSELLGSARFASLLEELKKNFEYIFIDSPPVLLVTDAQLISPLVDGYIIILRSGKTTKRLLTRCLALLGASKTSALGIVLNGIDAKSSAYSGYGYYGKGSYYGNDEN